MFAASFVRAYAPRAHRISLSSTSRALSTAAPSASVAVRQNVPSHPTEALPYFIPRNSRGSLPVYSDIRNGGTRHIVHIRNVQGDVQALAREIRKQFSSPDHTAKVEIRQDRHVSLYGGRWARQVTEFLTSQGF